MIDPDQVHMYWPQGPESKAPDIVVPEGYTLRTFKAGDETAFFALMDLVGWTGWDQKELDPWAIRLLPEGWFLVTHNETDTLVASAMSLHSVAIKDAGELGWVAGSPQHSGKGLGRLIASAVMNRFLEAKLHTIHLFTETYRLAAIKIYLRLGWEPVLVASDDKEKWKEVCGKLDWPFTPEKWESWDEILVEP